jgi:hypothetical protein
MDRRRTTFTFYPLAMFEKSNLADFGCFLQPLINKKKPQSFLGRFTIIYFFECSLRGNL